MKKPAMGSEFKPRERNSPRIHPRRHDLRNGGGGSLGNAPAPLLVNLGVGNLSVILGLITMFLGAYV
jgi:hypothetical protein